MHDGASVGFLPPLTDTDAEAYWRSVEAALNGSDNRVLLAAINGDSVFGTVQLDLADKANASHRAEVIKLMVHTTARRRGIARELMQEIEAVASERGRSLLVLDTRSGDASEQLYLSLGYERAGVIPRYARSASGELHGTVIMYRWLG